ncbi:MAG: hypothetical protein SCK70_03490 [bacterium]|nr:hypothetical protein [bacterium]
MTKIKYAVFLTIMCTPVLLFGQSGASLGLGGFTAISRGVDAVYWNPANLAFMEQGQANFQMKLFSLTIGTGNNSFSFNLINKYIGDGESIYLTEDDKNDILNLIADQGLVFDVSGKASVLSFAYKNWGFGIETHVYGNFSIPRDLYKNILFKIGQDSYDYSVDGGGCGVTKMKFSYGMNLIDDIILELPLLKHTIFKQVSGGVSVSYLQGIGYSQITKGTALLTISDFGILPKAEFEARTATLGSGLGVDFGFSSYTNNHWKIGMLFENVLGYIRWHRDAKVAAASLDLGVKPLFIIGEGQLSDLDFDSVTSDTSYAIGGFSTRLPFNFRMAFARDFGKYLINFELGHVDQASQAALGGRIKFGFFHLLGSMGRQMNNFQWNAAFALDFNKFYFDLGVSSRSGLTLGDTKGLFLGTSIKFWI